MKLLQLVQLAIAAVICTVATANAAPLRRQSHRHYTLDEYARAHAHLPRAHVKRVLADHAAFKRGRASPEQARHRAGSVHHVDGGVLVLGYYSMVVDVEQADHSTKPFHVLLDTGSSNLALATSKCADTSCASATEVYSPPAAGVAFYNSKACAVCNPSNDVSEQQQCVFGQPFATSSGLCAQGISYGGGSSYIDGYLSFANVTMDGFSLPEQGVVAITRMIPAEAFTAGGNIQGIIGFAHKLNACNPTCAPGVFDTLVSAQKTKGDPVDDIIGLCLDPSNGGSIDLGGVDKSKFTGELQWVPVTQQRWYNMQVLAVTVGNKPLNLPPFVYGFANDAIGTFVDSGTSAFLFGPIAFATLQAAFLDGRYSNLPGLGAGGIFDGGSCIAAAVMKPFIDQYPTVGIVFEGESGKSPVTIHVPATSYFLHTGNSYCFAISAVPSLGMVLGDVVMENYYIAHDRANKRVGFAPVKNCSP